MPELIPIPCPGRIADGFLVIDPLIIDCSGLPVEPCIPPQLEKLARALPHVIDVRKMNEAQHPLIASWARREIEEGRPPGLCGWLHGTANLADMVGHVSSYLSADGSSGQRVYWRWFDPRVLVLVANVFSERQISALLGPVHEWRFPWFGQWWSLKNPMVPDHDHFDGFPTAEQWKAIDTSASLAAVLAGLPDANQIAAHRKPALVAGAVEAFHGAELLHLVAKESQIEFVSMCLRFGTAFRNHYKLTAFWPALATNAMSWTDFIGLLDERDLERLERAAQPVHEEMT